MGATDYISLIYKSLANEISSNEKLMLDAWVAADEDNRMLLEQLKLIWENTAVDDLGLADVDVDLDTEFNFLQERLTAEDISIAPIQSNAPESEEPNDKKIIKFTSRFWGAAAGLALLIGLSWFFIANELGNENFAELTTGDEPKEIMLADGTHIYLNTNSSLKYPTTFDGAQREIEFTGEAFFDVARDPEHPFIVHTPYEDVTVLGTSFNVRAYENEPNSEVAVSSGSVKVNSGLTSAILAPNEKAIVDHSSRVMGVEKSESLNELAWHTKTIRFSNTPLSMVIIDLEHYYDVSIKVANASILNCPYTATFGEKDNFNTAIEAVATVFGITVKQDDNTHYTLVGGSCQ